MSPVESDPNPALLIAQVHRWRTAFFGLVILLAGVVIGAGAVLIWAAPRTAARLPPRMQGPGGDIRGPTGPAEVIVQRLKRSLQLSGQQVQAVRPIVSEHMANLNRIRQETRPKVAEQLRLMGQRIEERLNRDQRRLWDEQFRRLHEQLQWQSPGPRGRVQEPVGPALLPRGRAGRSPEPRPAEPGSGPQGEQPPAPAGGPEPTAPPKDSPILSQ